MATKRKARLNPVASPTDPFVQPGVVGPVQTNLDFGALNRFSGALQDLSRLQERDERRREREMQRRAPELVVGINKLVQDGTISRKEISFLYSDVPEDEVQAGIKVLLDHGIPFEDTPQGRLFMREGMARRSLHDAGYENHMQDPEFWGQFTNLMASEPERAEQLYRDRQAAFMETNGFQNLPTFAQMPFASETAEVDASVREKAQQEARVIRGQQQVLNLANDTSSFMQKVVDASQMKHADYHVTKAADGLRQHVEVLKMGKKPAEVFKMLQEAIKPQVLKLAAEDGVDIGNVLDTLEETFPDAAMEEYFRKLGEEADRVDRRKRADSRENFPAAAGELTGRILEHVASNDIRIDEFFNLQDGGALQFVEQVSGTTGVDRYRLLAELGTIERQVRAQQVTQSDPADLDLIKNKIAEGDSESARVLINSLPISGEDKLDLSARVVQMEELNARSNETKKNRDIAVKSIIADFQDLPPGTNSLQATLKAEGDQLWDSYWAENPEGSVTAAQRFVSQEIKKSGTFENLRGLQQRLTPEYWSGAPLDKMLATQVRFLDRELQGRLSAADPTDEGAKSELMATYGARERALKSAARSHIREIMDLPEWPSSGTEDQQRHFLEEQLGQREGRILQAARTGSDQATTKDRRTLGMQRLRNFAEVPLNPADAPSVTGRTDLNWNGWFNTNYEISSSATQNLLQAAWSGGELNWRTLSKNADSMKLTEVIASAKILGSTRGIDRDLLLDSEQGRTLHAFTSPQDAADRLRGHIFLRGLTPKEVLDGQTRYGVSLSDIFGRGPEKNWVADFPLNKVALYPSLEELTEASAKMEEDIEKSELARLMRALKFDPEDKQQVEGFISLQKNIITRLGGDRSGTSHGGGRFPSVPTGSNALRRLREPLKVRKGDTRWVKTLKEVATND